MRKEFVEGIWMIEDLHDWQVQKGKHSSRAKRKRNPD